MDKPIYPASIREFYETEILGETAFLALLDVARNDRDRYHFGTLLQLETETKARLRPFLCKYGLDLSEKADLSAVPTVVAAYEQSDWPAFMRVVIPIVEGFHARFQEIAALAPAEDGEMIEAMIHHEAIVLRWLTMESEGNHEGSLDGILAELRYPLPKPSA